MAKGNKKRDPNEPKRNLSAYLLFAQEYRPIVKTENATASFGQIGQILGCKWREMTEEEKRPFLERAEQEKLRFQKEKKEYEAKLPHLPIPSPVQGIPPHDMNYNARQQMPMRMYADQHDPQQQHYPQPMHPQHQPMQYQQNPAYMSMPTHDMYDQQRYQPVMQYYQQPHGGQHPMPEQGGIQGMQNVHPYCNQPMEFSPSRQPMHG